MPKIFFLHKEGVILQVAGVFLHGKGVVFHAEGVFFTPKACSSRQRRGFSR
jgi:hypothetical protein